MYGALLNNFFRFADSRMGASVTATGRQITTFMIEKIEHLVSGEYKQLCKTTVIDNAGAVRHEYTMDSESVVYGDTDSGYFKCLGATNKEEAVAIADLTAENVNASFPQFMKDAFFCQDEFSGMIKVGRELVGSRGLFQSKKKYMIKVVDLEGTAVNKLKSMGSEIKKSDTPKIIQQFLKEMVDQILEGVDYDSIAEFVNNRRRELIKNEQNLFALGVAKQVNNLDKYLAEYQNPGTIRTENGSKLTIPGHVRAACNYNALLGHFEPGGKLIRGGDKVFVFYLKKNEFNFDSIGLPAESLRFPSWFAENFKVDTAKTEQSMFDNKLSGIFSALNKDVPSPQSVLVNRLLSF